MAGTKISELPAATLPLTGAETVPVVQSGATKQTALATIPYVPSGTGAVTRTVQAKLRETVSVKDFGAVGNGVTDDTAAIQAAINTQKRVYFPAGTYKTTSHITVNGSYFDIYGDGNSLSRINGTGFISLTTVADTSYPTSSNPGPMSGSCFYFTSLIYYSKMQGILFSDFKFVNAYLNPHNSPSFVECEYRDCNAFVFCYQGSQNHYYESMRSGGTKSGPLHISSATCFPSGTPYAGSDNYYTDGFTYVNGNGSLSPAGVVNSAFDTWFQDSILRPSVGSYSVGTSNYIYPFSSSDAVSKPSGWALAYVPMRNPRALFGVEVKDLDLRFGMSYGAGCFNGTIFYGEINSYNFENQSGTFEYHFAIGSVGNLTVQSVKTTSSGNPQKPFFRLTGAGYSSGVYEENNKNIVYLNCEISTPIFQSTGSATTLYFHQTLNKNSASSDVISTNYSLADGSIDGRADAGMNLDPNISAYGNLLLDNRNVSSWNFGASFPFFDGSHWHRFINLRTGYGDWTGLFQLAVANITTGETDYGEFYAQMGNTYTLTTAADINNGDYTITVTSAPPRGFSRFSQFTVGGVTVVAKSYSSSTKVITLEGPVAGLAAVVSSGATITKTYFIRTVTPFKRAFAALQFGGFPYSNSYDLCLGSLVSSYATTLGVNDNALYISGTFTQMKSPPIFSVSAAPTTGKWATGAIVYNTSPASAGYVGWVCTSGGTPGTWKTFGLIS